MSKSAAADAGMSCAGVPSFAQANGGKPTSLEFHASDFSVIAVGGLPGSDSTINWMK